MKIKNFFSLFFVVLTLFFSVKTAFGNPDEAREWAINKGENILQILGNKNLEQKYAELDKILYEDIDLDHVARFVLGRYWRKMSEKQKEIYIPLFKRYTAAVYKAFPLDIKESAIGYEILKIQPNKNFYDVFCSINFNGEATSKLEKTAKIGVIFSLSRQNNKIMVRDLKIGESSLLAAYRERFYEMIHEDNDDDLEWFLEDLESITVDKEAENQKLLDRQ